MRFQCGFSQCFQGGGPCVERLAELVSHPLGPHQGAANPPVVLRLHLVEVADGVVEKRVKAVCVRVVLVSRLDPARARAATETTDAIRAQGRRVVL